VTTPGPARRTGIADLPLHGGKAPRWLFERMTNLAREITVHIVSEYGPDEMLHRISDPHWFQAFGCVLGFDWHSSGVTTTLCGALKEGLKGQERNLGLFVAGGKGRTSRQTPAQIESFEHAISADPSCLVYASRMAAKVDTSGLQDGYQLYHHTFIFTEKGSWAVVQQGMNEDTRYARRYHWLGEAVTDFVCDPHAAICCEGIGKVLNLVDEESTLARTTIAAIATQEKPEKNLAQLKQIKTLSFPSRHYIIPDDINPDRLTKGILLAYDRQPKDFEELLSLQGIGPKSIRALALISELIHGAPASFSDPVRYSFAHGGKDGHPFPVDRQTYDKSIEVLSQAVYKAKIDSAEKSEALRRLEMIR
jgi:hypothetical protein